MDSEKVLRLAELEEMEAKWRKRYEVVRCRGCNAELGHAEFNMPPADVPMGVTITGIPTRDKFKPTQPTVLRVRGGSGRPITGRGTRIWPTPQLVRDPEVRERARTDTTSSPLLVDAIQDGIRCDDCGAHHPRVPLAPAFGYAREIATLRRRRWVERNMIATGIDDDLY